MSQVVLQYELTETQRGGDFCRNRQRREDAELRAEVISHVQNVVPQCLGLSGTLPPGVTGLGPLYLN